MSGKPPLLSVVVPVKDGAALLPTCLAALAASELGRERWELIVVDDGSTDESRRVAEHWADRVLTVADGPRGPAWARNRGAEIARGEWLVFVDADVVVHPDTLTRIARTVEEERALVALFGAYDDAPEAPGFLSQYRNLFHRYVHLHAAGEAETFWAGCGAVRRESFLALGGFDTRMFPRPQIEDIELGYRLRDAGGRIVLRPEIQGKHLKAWSFWGILRTDLFDRGIPWMRLMLQRGGDGGGGSLNVRPAEKLKTALVGGALALVLLALVLEAPLLLAGAAASVLAVVAMNRALYRWFAERRGWWFAVRVIPMNLLYYLVNGTCAAAGWMLHVRDRLSGSRPPIRSSGPDGRTRLVRREAVP